MNSGKGKNTYIIWILGLLSTISPFAIDLYLPAFAEIADHFHTTPAKISLSVSSYFVGMALGQILYGPLLDRFGRKPPLYAGLTVFIIASITCTLSTSDQFLIIARFFQAIGGSVAWVAAVTMVRDFFPVSESSKVFSLLILILGVSPLLAPTIGGFIATSLGWKAIFFMLAVLALLTLSIVYTLLPAAREPDRSVSLKAGPMLSTFTSVLRNAQFSTYAFAGAFSFSTLFIYVAGSPIIFMDIFHVSPQTYGGIFALLSVGFIGGSQLNIFLTKTYPNEQVFKVALIVQIATSTLFFLFAWNDWLVLNNTLLFFFICLTCIGLINPNASALAIAPFTRNIGSASALLGFIQLGTAALTSSGVGIFESKETYPIICLMLITSAIAGLILGVGRKIIGEGTVTVNDTATPSMH
ncbi:multidrug effflux MFS transporter [Chryseosolibacter indicus]|uniref:Multidrug effflux MFS transporter n=1 Tax=Chryseosolibacter indicus TaxID=2782351 RepID=A0ABS5VS71_9BACT|nr:multidrug effflux MFS transporter [Chryseosolibacter indicus]MBT1703685.1 multidrug effflux MFS transporter [Chryseosolibacter indicus]